MTKSDNSWIMKVIMAMIPRVRRLDEQVGDMSRQVGDMSRQVGEMSREVNLAQMYSRELERRLANQVSVNSQVDSLAGLIRQNTERLLSKLAAMEYRDVEGRRPPAGPNHPGHYLDLMEGVLTGMIYEDIPIRNAWSTENYDEEIRLLGRDWPTSALTMIGAARMRNLRTLLEAVLADGIPGDFIETGVWRGGACIYARAIFEAYAATDRTVWVADSFRGLPAPDRATFPADKGDLHHTVTELSVSADTVRANFARFGLLDAQVKFLEGWFKDTLPNASIGRLAVLRLDGDMYQSTWESLIALYPKVSPGGFVIIDDYLLPPCRQAVDEFRRTGNIGAPLQEIDGAAVFWRV